MRAADWLIGLPQSLQNRAAGSFSWPQKAQDVFTGSELNGLEEEGKEVTRSPRCKTAWAANIGREKGGVNEGNAYKIVWRRMFPP